MRASPDLVQFPQRLMAYYHLGPPDLQETAESTGHRPQVAGGKTSTFHRDSYDVICRYTAGVPRLINIICHTALNYAFAAKKENCPCGLCCVNCFRLTATRIHNPKVAD